MIPTVTVIYFRCSRCRKSTEAMSTDIPKDYGYIRYGQNLHYCLLCAEKTGYYQPCSTKMRL
ncbi:hypothetical protein GGI42DRAFT_337373 [Trichoderma sp. SZMC 28013]